MNVIQQAHEVYGLHSGLIEKPKALARLGVGRELSEHDNKANLFKIGKIYGLRPSNASLTGYPDEIARKTKKDALRSQSSYRSCGNFAELHRDWAIRSHQRRSVAYKATASSKQDAAYAKIKQKWWALDLHSTLSESKIEKARALHYSAD